MHPLTRLRTILFDLDGTLLDTAPDLILALNTVLQQRGIRPLAREQAAPLISTGAAGMIRFAAPGLSEACVSTWVEEMVSSYRQHLAEQTRPYEGITEVLEWVESRGLTWGIVTNKLAGLTEPLMEAIDLAHRPACIISGDTTPQRKPHPAPLLEACRKLGSPPDQCVYIGDAERDIEAGRRAGMATLAATYGYLSPKDRPEQWGACELVQSPRQILNWLENHA